MLSRNQTESTQYEKSLLAGVEDSCRRTEDFQDICRSLRGAFPGEVARFLPAGPQRHAVEPITVADVLGANAPEPHPIDFDWRFVDSTANALASLTGGFNRVLCFGTPSVFNAIARQGRHVCLVDRNPFLPRVLHRATAARYIIEDIADIEHIDGAFDAAILDPPWYLPSYELWLSKVIPLLTSGASIFLVLFRDLTRPDATSQRRGLLEKLTSIGTVSVQSHEAQYSTPRFELEVLRRLGLPHLPAWRIGDVVRIDLREGIRRWPFSELVPSPKQAWSRFLVGRQVIAVAVKDGDLGPITYRAPEGDVFALDSVSERDPRRLQIGLWTSRNYAAVVAGTQRLASLLAAHADDAMPRPAPTIGSAEDMITFKQAVRDLRLGLGELVDA